MYLPNPETPKADPRIAGTEADGLLHKRDRLLYRPDIDLASADIGYCVHPVAIERERRLVFGNGLLAPTRGAPEVISGKVRNRVAGGCRQGLPAPSPPLLSGEAGLEPLLGN